MRFFVFFALHSMMMCWILSSLDHLVMPLSATIIYPCSCYRLEPQESLFAGHIAKSSSNNTSAVKSSLNPAGDLKCACKLSPTEDQTISRFNEVTTNRFFQSGSLDIKHNVAQCTARQCQDRRGVSLLSKIIEASSLEDLEYLSPTSLELDSSENQVKVGLGIFLNIRIDRLINAIRISEGGRREFCCYFNG